MAAQSPAPAPAAPTGAPAPAPNRPEEPTNIATGAKLPIPVNGTGFTMTLPDKGGPIEPPVDGMGRPIDASTGQLLPPPEPAEQAKADGPDKWDPKLYSHELTLQTLSDRIKRATSPNLQGPLDPNSATGRVDNISTYFPYTSAIDRDSPLGGIYDFGKRMILSPMLSRSVKPFGQVTGMNTRSAAPIYRGAADIAAISGPGQPSGGVGLLGNWVGSLAGKFLGGDSQFDTAGMEEEARRALGAIHT